MTGFDSKRQASLDKLVEMFAEVGAVQGATLQVRLDKAIAAKDKTRADLDKADADWDKAIADWDKAHDKWHKAYAEVERLHQLIEEKNT